MLECWNCGSDVSTEPLPISRHATCEQCGEYLHCCRFCEHFDRDRPGQCGNELADPPNEKTSANFCEYFTLERKAYRGKTATNASVKDKLSSLFGDDAREESSDGANKGTESNNPLDNLFND
jgi:hypothetical protein